MFTLGLILGKFFSLIFTTQYHDKERKKLDHFKFNFSKPKNTRESKVWAYIVMLFLLEVFLGVLKALKPLKKILKLPLVFISITLSVINRPGVAGAVL